MDDLKVAFHLSCGAVAVELTAHFYFRGLAFDDELIWPGQ
jgi:hypothetical protein